jgi:hypothetical protein
VVGKSVDGETSREQKFELGKLAAMLDRFVDSREASNSADAQNSIAIPMAIDVNRLSKCSGPCGFSFNLG